MTISQPLVMQGSYDNSSFTQKNKQDEEKITTKDNKPAEEKTTNEQQIIKKLQARDSEVRAHEAAHIAAGAGVVTGGASFTYQKGPDGALYAIGGEVPIDASKESDPQATIMKMQKVKAAALAPSDPSPTDIKIASTASLMEAKAQEELKKQEQEELKKEHSKESSLNSYAQNEDEISQKNQLSLAI